MKKIISCAVMAVGVILLLATESDSGLTNIAGLGIVWYELEKMGLFYK